MCIYNRIQTVRAGEIYSKCIFEDDQPGANIHSSHTELRIIIEKIQKKKKERIIIKNIFPSFWCAQSAHTHTHREYFIDMKVNSLVGVEGDSVFAFKLLRCNRFFTL